MRTFVKGLPRSFIFAQLIKAELDFSFCKSAIVCESTILSLCVGVYVCWPHRVSVATLYPEGVQSGTLSSSSGCCWSHQWYHLMEDWRDSLFAFCCSCHICVSIRTQNWPITVCWICGKHKLGSTDRWKHVIEQLWLETPKILCWRATRKSSLSSLTAFLICFLVYQIVQTIQSLF